MPRKIIDCKVLISAQKIQDKMPRLLEKGFEPMAPAVEGEEYIIITMVKYKEETNV